MKPHKLRVSIYTLKYTPAIVLQSAFIWFQVAVHREGHAHLSKVVEDLEQKNLEIMSEMFDCKVEDLKFTRSVRWIVFIFLLEKKLWLSEVNRSGNNSVSALQVSRKA